MYLIKTTCCFLTGILLLMPVGLNAAETKPNIVLIMADDVGSDAIGCYGGRSYPTPHIDALAKGGMKFNHAYAMPVCHPTRVCLMTGRYPFRFGKAGSKWGDYPRDAEGISIGNRMQQAGYATAVAGKWQLCMMKNDKQHPSRVGFDEWCLFGWHEGGRYHRPLIYQNGALRDDASSLYGPEVYTDFLIDFMKRSHKAGKPFFAYYPMALCHDVTDDLKDEHVAYYKHGRWMTFGEMMASMDDMVGKVVASLNEMGVRDNTLIIFTTDNGTPGASYLTVNENGKMVRPKIVSVQNDKIVPGGKGKLDDTGTRVPLIANWPGHIKADTEVDDMVDMSDYLPTVAEIAGLKQPDVPRDGISFAPVLFGKPEQRQTREWIYIELRNKSCVRSPEWKLYRDGRFFNVAQDPGEKSPLKSDQLTGTAKQKYAKLASVLDDLQGPLPQP
ncbi:sulfatase-like hydrolase/transferase [Gimesia sp.]|uniref:sulfatase-like hydrolase/transferase n=1 Tax=Gimesia sp. TaxID=2024833 RepID=UPI003A9504C8